MDDWTTGASSTGCSGSRRTTRRRSRTPNWSAGLTNAGASSSWDTSIGELAVAVWDGRSRELLLGCSAPLSRPLVYSSGAGRFAFAQPPSGSVRASGFDATRGRTGRRRSSQFPDSRRAAHALLRSSIAWFRARRLTVDRRGTRIERWWQPNLAARLRLSSADEYVAAFDELLQRVIEDHLSADGPTGVMLSGGLDSGAVAAVAASRLAVSGRPLRTYTEVPPAGFSGPVALGRMATSPDASPRWPRCMETFAHSSSMAQVAGLLDGIDDYLSYAEMPFVNAANRGWIEAILSHAAEDGVRCAAHRRPGQPHRQLGRGRPTEPVAAPGSRRARGERGQGARAGRKLPSTGRALARLGILPLLPDAVSRGIWWLAGRASAGAGDGPHAPADQRPLG